MLRLTKIVHFEMAHAIHGYPGSCKNIHGHSYELHVTVSSGKEHLHYIPAPGFIVDFKELKHLVTKTVLHTFDHKLVLSQAYLNQNTGIHSAENLVTWEMEPTAENLLLNIKETLIKQLPLEINLVKLKLYETKDSYAEWLNENIFN